MVNRSQLVDLAASPINTTALANEMKDYPFDDEKALLLDGFRFGFRIPYHGPREKRLSKNHGSALKQPDIIWKKLQEEISLGRVAGPFDVIPLQNLIVSPIGLVPKSNPGEYRLIFDLSYPQGESINSGISREDSAVSYTKFDKVITMVRQEGRGAYLFKVDIKSAFRLLPIHPQDFQLLGMEFQGKYFVDKCLPFGLSVSCSLFEKFSCFLEWHIQKVTLSKMIIHYLDDFCGCQSDREKAEHILNKILASFAKLGVPVAQEKVEGPVTCLKFLGLEVDTVAMQVRIPQEKLDDLRKTIAWVISLADRKITLKELQSLIGKLNFACKAILPGRAFCRRLIDATIGVKKSFHKIRVSRNMVKDLVTWQSFLKNYNGATMMLDEDSKILDLYTDASGGLGFGAYFEGHWTMGPWPEKIQSSKIDIMYKELFPIVLSLLLWGESFKNSRVVFHCDNAAVVAIVNKQSTPHKLSMGLLRLLVYFCLINNIVFRAKHIPGKSNGIADALSRFQLKRFKILAPQADKVITAIPSQIWTQLLRKLDA